jgi:glycosyltransferase involved in cell wall biosynthesis
MEANKKLYPDNAKKITNIGWGPNIIPPSLNEILESCRQTRVLCVGHDYYKKGVDIFNEVSRALRRHIANVECAIIGRPEYGLDISKLDNLTIYPAATPEEVSSMMKTSKVFMIFSRFDAAGHVTVEAMSHGLPVICSNVCGMPEPIIDGKTGYVVSTSNTNDIVEKACELLTDDGKLETFRKNAYEHAVENWQWKNVAGRVLNTHSLSRRGRC